MTESRFDYLTISIKPEHTVDPFELDYHGWTPFQRCLITLKNTLMLDDLISKMEDKGRCLYYDRRLTYENISLKLPTPEKYPEQGISLVFSGQGLDYFNRYLDYYGLNLRQWSGMVRALCFHGYAINFSRIDYAMDNITKVGEPTTLSMKRVFNAIAAGELCCKARVWSDQGDDFRRLFSYKSKIKRVRGEELHGLTLQFGARTSDSICRFYDKLTEQKMKGNELPEDCAAWTRCEFEFHDSDAMAVMNAFIDYEPDDFANYMCGVALEKVRFVERTSDNVTRCQNKRWWKAFLNGATERIKFHKTKLARSAFGRFSRHFKKSVVPNICNVIEVWGFDGFADWLQSCIDEQLQSGRDLERKELKHNLKDGSFVCETWDGFKRFDYNSALSSEELTENIHRQHWDYSQQFYKVMRLGYRNERAIT